MKIDKTTVVDLSELQEVVPAVKEEEKVKCRLCGLDVSYPIDECGICCALLGTPGKTDLFLYNVLSHIQDCCGTKAVVDFVLESIEEIEECNNILNNYK